jgi:hypothetical protein
MTQARWTSEIRLVAQFVGLSTSGRAGVLKGLLALNLLPFKGYLTSAEAAHTDIPGSQYRFLRTDDRSSQHTDIRAKKA